MRLRLLAVAGTLTAALALAAAPAGAFVVVPKPLASTTNGIALGPDGNLWVSESAAGSVQRMAPDGTVLNTYPVGATPQTVAAGPGGRVWVAVTGADKLTWFDATAATPTAHDVPTGPSTCGPIGLIAGGDGRMYFSLPLNGGCVGGNVLGSVAADGTGLTTAAAVGGPVLDLAASSGKIYAPDFANDVVRRVALGTPTPEASISLGSGSNPNGIAADGAGNLWVTEFGTGKVARFAAAAAGGTAANEFAPTGGTLSGPAGIVAGADGNMYVAGFASQNVARVSPDGAFTLYPIPNAQPFDVVNGADGDLWFTDQGSARVLRFVNSAPRASTDSATVTSFTTASARATVNPRGNDTSVVFEYGPTTAYGATTAPQTVLAGADPVAVGAEIGGLLPTTYHVRVRATNAEGTAVGADFSLTTTILLGPGVKTSPPGPKPIGAVTSFRFVRHATFTTITRITLSKLAGGETATIRCSGSEKCAFKTKTYTKLKKGTRAIGKALLKARRLPVGTAVTVQLTQAGAIGRSVAFKVRKRTTPQITRRCLPPGAKSPVKCA